MMGGIVRYTLIGALSGGVFGLWNFVVMPELDSGNSQFWDITEMISNETGAGVVYGLIVGAALRKSLDFASPLSWLVFVVAAGASYFAAVRFTITLYEPGSSDTVAAAIGAAAGLLGASLLSSATALLAPQVRRPAFFIATAIAGAVVGLLLPAGINADSDLTWIVFFVLWQAAYAGAGAWGARLA